MVRKYAVRFAAVTVVIAGTCLISSRFNRATQTPPEPPVPTVTVAPVERKEIVEWSEFTGRTEAVEAVEVRPRISGYIQEIKFRSGQMVKKGDVLFVVDPRWQQADFDRRNAEAERARTQMENAKREADRSQQLLTSKAISTEEADARMSRYNETKAVFQAAVAGRDSARLDLDHTEVKAPISGRVSRALLTEGNYVSGLAGGATLLTTLVSVDPVYALMDMDEETLLKFNSLVAAKKLETNLDGRVPVVLQLADEDTFPHEGYIESFDNQVNPSTGSILVRAVFPNDDGRIVPGLFARLRVPSSARYPAILIHESAIGTDQAQKYVLTLSPTNTVAYKSVTLGPSIDGKRVVRTGLHHGEKVVVNGLQRVRPGSPVRAEESASLSARN